MVEMLPDLHCQAKPARTANRTGGEGGQPEDGAGAERWSGRVVRGEGEVAGEAGMRYLGVMRPPSEDETGLYSSPCLSCKHLWGPDKHGTSQCYAFPEAIPMAIMCPGGTGHSIPRPDLGQVNEVVWEPKDEATP